MDIGCGTGMLTIGCALVETDHIISVDCDSDAMNVARENVFEMLGDDEEAEGDEGMCSPLVDFVFAKVQHSASEEFMTMAASGRGGRSGGKGGRGRGRGGRGGRGGKRNSSGRGRGDNGSAGSSGRNSQQLHDGLPFRRNCVDTVLTNPPFGTKQNAGIDVTFLRAATRLASRAVYSFHKSSTRSYLVKTVKEWGYDVEVVAQMHFDIPNMYKFHKQDSVDIQVDLVRVIIDVK